MQLAGADAGAPRAKASAFHFRPSRTFKCILCNVSSKMFGSADEWPAQEVGLDTCFDCLWADPPPGNTENIVQRFLPEPLVTNHVTVRLPSPEEP